MKKMRQSIISIIGERRMMAPSGEYKHDKVQRNIKLRAL